MNQLRITHLKLTRFSQLLRTLYHLKPRQISYQVIRRFGPRLKPPDFNGPVSLRENVVLLTAPVQRQMTEDENTFSFLNVQRRFDPDCFDWSPRNVGKLWRYNLHYFDYLHEENRPFQNKAFLIENWIRNVPRQTEDAWEPFPVSLRIVNWTKWFLSPETEGKVQDSWLHSLYEQVLWLEKNIEYHLLANHLFKNGKALIFAGLYFEGADADKWLKKGLGIVLPELEEQILPDGGHFERSPMYHSMILEDILDLLNLINGQSHGELANLVQVLRLKAEKMAVFLWGMTHPDGQIALFNDAAFNIEAKPDDLLSYNEHVTGNCIARDIPRIRQFPDTGYFTMAPRTGDRLIVDCGPIGPDYQPGHSHCDTLSFELSINGRRVMVDSGCCQYEDSDIRMYNRGNAGHNTVTVDGKTQSEVWGAHRCARRARPLSPKLYGAENGALIFEGAHDGYAHLSGRPIHRRKVRWQGSEILIEDRIKGNGRHAIESRLHIHPDMLVEVENESVLISDSNGPIVSVSSNGPGHVELTKGWYCPEFGIQQSCKVLCLKSETTSFPFKIGWRFHLLT